MPKRYRRVKTVVRKAKWNSVMSFYDLPVVSVIAGDGSTLSANAVPVILNGSANAGVSSTTTHPIIKVRHLKAQVSIPIAEPLHWHRALIGFCFLPQGYDFSNTTIQYHPEWVFCTKPIFAQGSTVITASITSPLSRNLNSGDKIVFFCMRANKHGTVPAPVINLHPYISYVTRVN